MVLGAIPFAGPLLALAAWTNIIMTIRSSPLRVGTHDRLAGGTRVIRLASIVVGRDRSANHGL